MTIAFRPLRNPNPLGFPGGVRPGFDPSHAAAPNTYFSIVSSPTRCFDVLMGLAGVLPAGPSTPGTAAFGPVITSLASGNTRYTFTGAPAVANQNVTMAGIFSADSVSANRAFAQIDSTSDHGYFAGIDSTGVANFVKSTVVAINSTIALSVSVPYFMVVSSSVSANIVNFVVVNLLTGQVKTSSVANSQNSTAPNGGFTYGNHASVSYGGLSTAAAMFAASYMPLQKMLAWAADPWSFWYPQRDTALVGASNLRIISTDLDLPRGLFAPNLNPGYRNKPSLAFPSSGIFSSLAISQGVYTLTGKPQTPNSSRSISAAEGTYTQTGEAQNLLRGRPISAAQGTYSLTGEPQNFNRGIKVSAVQGAYTQTGEPQTLGVGIPTVQGSYTLTGKPQSFAVALSIKPVTGVYTLTGLPQVLTNTKFGTSGQALGTKFIADTGNMTSRDY